LPCISRASFPLTAHLHCAGRQCRPLLLQGKISDSLTRARRLVADGKGNEPATLDDFEGDRGTYQNRRHSCRLPDVFDPDGAMNMERAARAAKPGTPILWIVPKRERPALLKTNLPMYRLLTSNPLTRLYEPDSDHRGAPPASADEIVRWTREVAGSLR
jgi:hypothetical protein